MYKLSKSKKKDKKFQVITPNNKTIHFGAKGYSDYTIHKDFNRKMRYIQRHKDKENWTKRGINTSGFWAKHILWNKPTIKESIKNVESKYNIKIIYY